MSQLTTINRVCASAWNRAVLILSLCIIFSTVTGKMEMMRKFSSLKDLETFAKINLSVDIHASRLKSYNDAYDNIVDSLEEIDGLVNLGGG